MATTFKSYRGLEVWQKSMAELETIGKMLRGLAKSLTRRRNV